MSKINVATTVQFYKRGEKEPRTEVVLGGNMITWAYLGPLDFIMIPLISKFSILSKLLGMYMDSAFSRNRIRKVIDHLEIDESEFLDSIDDYKSFNDFFIRKLKPESREFDSNSSAFISPADCRLLVYPNVANDRIIPVKGVDFSINTLLMREASEFYNGSAAVLRLNPSDYHRYHFPCDAHVMDSTAISGSYHSVNPVVLAADIKVFTKNKRCCTILKNPLYGTFAFIEVGAFGVGEIVETYSGQNVIKMQEKGYFKFGGSSIVLLFEKNKIQFSPDLIENSRNGYETSVKVGETIGESLINSDQ